MINDKDISFIQPIPLKHMSPVGLMPNTRESCALWQFLVCAHQALSRVESQKTLEGDEDQQADLMQLANSCRRVFELSELDGMFNMNLISMAKAECVRSNLPWDSRLDAFFESGGKSYRHLDRDADKVSQ